jgi:uncharacterized peroxidase-related enzyme
MSRLTRLGRSQVSGALKDGFERKIAERGNIPNMYRVAAHRPWLATTLDTHLAAVMGSGTLPLKLKELLAVQCALLDGCDYSRLAHTPLALQTGASEEQVAALLDFENGPFSEKEKAVLRYGLQVARDPSRVSDEAFAELSRHLNEGEIVEVTCVVGLFAYLNRFNQALRVEPTRPGEGVDS